MTSKDMAERIGELTNVLQKYMQDETSKNIFATAEVEREIAEELAKLNVPTLQQFNSIIEASLVFKRMGKLDRSNEVEPCCECGEDYPRVDLARFGQIFCPTCRENEKINPQRR